MKLKIQFKFRATERKTAEAAGKPGKRQGI